MNLKVGDKLLCKKNYICSEIGTFCIIEYIDERDNSISIDGIWFNRYVITDNRFKRFDYIWDYFYTPQETRKLKLNKLCIK